MYFSAFGFMHHKWTCKKRDKKLLEIFKVGFIRNSFPAIHFLTGEVLACLSAEEFSADCLIPYNKYREGDGFWENICRYSRYVSTSLLLNSCLSTSFILIITDKSPTTIYFLKMFHFFFVIYTDFKKDQLYLFWKL